MQEDGPDPPHMSPTNLTIAPELLDGTIAMLRLNPREPKLKRWESQRSVGALPALRRGRGVYQLDPPSVGPAEILDVLSRRSHSFSNWKRWTV